MVALGKYFFRVSEWWSTAQKNSSFHVTKSTLFNHVMDICVYNFPDLLDVQGTSYATVPIYFSAGFVDYIIIHMILATYRQLTGLWMPKDDFTLIYISNPDPRILQAALFVSFALRAWRFEIANITDVCDLKSLRWSQVQKLSLLLLLLCPALYWHCFFESLLHLFNVDRNRPWIAVAAYYIISGDWDTASFFSGWGIVDALHAKDKSGAVSSQSTSTGGLWGFTKRVAILSFFSTLVTCLPHLILTLIMIVEALLEEIASPVKEKVKQLQRQKLVRTLLSIELKAVAARDAAMVTCLHYLRGELPFGKYVLMVIDSAIAEKLNAGLSIGALFCVGATKLCLRLLSLITKLLAPASVSDWCLGPVDSSASSGSEGRQIRLLELIPSLFDQDVVACRLSWYNLDTAPKYTAISYVWGSGEHSSTILLNGKSYKTTASARTALKALRSRIYTLRFWIDAICIDQESIEDKAEQISMMADIYKNAKRVTVWLGPDAGGGLALGLARRLFTRVRLLKHPDAAGFRYSHDVPEYAWDSLRQTLRNPWFERSWVVQEAMSNNVTIQCGHATIGWGLFAKFVMAIINDSEVMEELLQKETSQDSITKLDFARPHTLKLDHVRVFEDFRSVCARKKRQKTMSLLFYLVRMYRSKCRFKATETKDRIYALVNLCGLAKEPQFRTDYKLSNAMAITEADLFIETARYLLSNGPETRRLDLLAHAGSVAECKRNRGKHVPSWVPDWSIENYPSIPFIGQDGMAELLRHPRLEDVLKDAAELKSYDEVSYASERPEQKAALKQLQDSANTISSTVFFRAARDTLPQIKIYTDDRDLLELQGVYGDTVQLVGVEMPSLTLQSATNLTVDDVYTIGQVLLSWYLLFYASYPANTRNSVDLNRQRLYNFCRTVLTDVEHPIVDFASTNMPIRPMPDSALDLVKSYLIALLVQLSGKLGDDSVSAYLKRLGDASFSRLIRLLVHINTVCAGRVFGQTHGGLPCLLPRGSKVCDQICIFFGGATPFVLRPLPDTSSMIEVDEQAPTGPLSPEDATTTYELIGPAYVHGYMDGEALVDNSPMTFRLR